MSIIEVVSQTGHALPAFVTPDGQYRLLASLPGERSYKATPYAAENPVIPRSDWFEFDRHRDDVPIKDQKQEGSCVANGWVSMLERARSAAGHTHVDLSRAFLYALINGGRDAGANPTDAAEALKDYGVCTEATLPYSFVVARQLTAAMKAEAKRFALEGGAIYACNSFDELVSAELLGFKTGMTVLAAGQFAYLDDDGCPPVHRGVGNHWQSCDSRLKRARNRDWLLGGLQSWGIQVWDQGKGLFREAHWDLQRDAQGYAIRWPGQDPNDPNIAPIAR